MSQEEKLNFVLSLEDYDPVFKQYIQDRQTGQELPIDCYIDYYNSLSKNNENEE